MLLTLASTYCLRPLEGLRTALSGTPLAAAVGLVVMLRADAFLPWALWRFIGLFPRSLAGGRRATQLRVGERVALWAGAIMLVSWVVGTLARGPSGEVLDGWRLAYHGLVCLLALAVLPWLVLRAIEERGEDRVRVQLFLGALIVAIGPATVDVVLTALLPARQQYLTASSPWPQALRLYGEMAALLMLPFGSAYAAGPARVLSVRTLTRRAGQYLLARGVLQFGALLPVGLLVWYGAEHRRESLEAFARQGHVQVLVAVAVATWALTWVRPALLERLDRAFDRERVRGGELIRVVGELIHSARTREDLVALVAPALTDGLRVTRARLLTVSSGGELVDTTSELRLASDAGLYRQLEDSHEEIVIEAGTSEQWQTLDARERAFLTEAPAEVLVPVRDRAGTLVGALAVGAKRSGLAFDREDRQLLRGLAAALGFASEVLMNGAAAAGASDAEVAGECPACGRVFAAGTERCDACDRPLAAALLPAVLGDRYRLLRRLGAGGAGVVYQGVDPWLRRELAFKTLTWLRSKQAVELRREARVLASLRHPNLATVYDLEVWRATPVVVMEYLPGGTLAQRLKNGPLTGGEAKALGIALCGALDYLHRRGILHRDIKPGNIGFDGEGQVKLLDFGLATLSQPLDGAAGLDEDGEGASDDDFGIAGTLHYLSPETLQGERPTVLCDLWGLSVTLWEAVSGKRAFEGDMITEVARRIAHVEIAPTAEPQTAVAELLRSTLDPDPRRRPQSAAALAAFLNKLVG